MIMYLDQAILKLYETYKKILGKGWGRIIYPIIDHNIIT